MFSKKYSISVAEVKSSLKTAANATVAYFTLTISVLYEQIMALNWKYLVSIAVFFVLVFSIKLVEKYFRDGDTLNEAFTHEILDQNRKNEHSVDS